MNRKLQFPSLELGFPLQCGGPRQETRRMDGLQWQRAALSQNCKGQELELDSKRTSLDSDCSFYEIEPEGRSTLRFEIELEGEEFDDAIFSFKTTCPGTPGIDRKRYRAWIGARNLHIA